MQLLHLALVPSLRPCCVCCLPFLQAKLLAHAQAHTGPAWGLDFSAEGGMLATGGADNQVKLWDVAWLASVRLSTPCARHISARAIGHGRKPRSERGLACTACAMPRRRNPAVAGQHRASERFLSSDRSLARVSPLLFPFSPSAQRHAGTGSLACVRALPTKNAPAYSVRFTRQNLLFAVGPKQ